MINYIFLQSRNTFNIFLLEYYVNIIFMNITFYLKIVLKN